MLAETAETAALALVPQLRSCLLERQGRPPATAGLGKDIRFLTKFRAYRQLAERLVFGARKDRHIQEEEPAQA